MSRGANLIWGIFVVVALYALAVWMLVVTLSFSRFPALLGTVLAVLPALAALFAFRRNPDGRWWIIPMIAVVVTSALLLGGIVILLMGSDA